MSKILLFLILFICCCLLPQGVYAKQDDGWLHEIRLGILDHDTDNLLSGFSREDGVDFNGELVFEPCWELWSGTVRPNLGVSINDRGNTSKFYGGGLWEHGWNNSWFLDFGLGLAAHNGETGHPSNHDKKALGYRVLFRLTVEAGYTFAKHHRMSLMFDHVSNAELDDFNEGLDTIGVRYGYVF